MLSRTVELKKQMEIEAMFSKHYKEWCMLSYSYMEDMSEAEDLVQDIFVKILNRDNYDEIRNLKKYINTAIRNTCLKRITQTKRLVQIKENKLAAFPSHEQYLIDEETRMEVREALVVLPKKTKLVFELCVLEGLKYRMASDILGISINTIKFHLKKAFKMLRMNLRNTHF